MKGKYLITTDNWFLAPDGQMYQGVWGDVSIISDEVLGLKTNRNSTNWYVKVGPEDNHVIIAGCQIHFAVRSEKPPSFAPCHIDEHYEGKNISRPTASRIYFTEGKLYQNRRS